MEGDDLSNFQYLRQTHLRSNVAEIADVSVGRIAAAMTRSVWIEMRSS